MLPHLFSAFKFERLKRFTSCNIELSTYNPLPRPRNFPRPITIAALARPKTTPADFNWAKERRRRQSHDKAWPSWLDSTRLNSSCALLLCASFWQGCAACNTHTHLFLYLPLCCPPFQGMWQVVCLLLLSLSLSHTLGGKFNVEAITQKLHEYSSTSSFPFHLSFPHNLSLSHSARPVVTRI